MANLRRGLFRVWVVASLCWVGAWLGYVWATCVTPPGQTVYFCRIGLFDDWMKQITYFTFWDYLTFAVSTLSVPIILLTLGSAVWWAVNGFR
jgi:hypothetical protein